MSTQLIVLFTIIIFLSSQVTPHSNSSDDLTTTDQVLAKNLLKLLAQVVKKPQVKQEPLELTEEEEALLIGGTLALPQVTELVGAVLKGNLNLTSSLFHKNYIKIPSALRNPVKSLVKIISKLTSGPSTTINFRNDVTTPYYLLWTTTTEKLIEFQPATEFLPETAHFLQSKGHYKIRNRNKNGTISNNPHVQASKLLGQRQ